MEQSFDITEHDVGGLPVVSVAGEIDVATAPQLRKRLQRLSAEGRTTIVVDLLGVSFLDSTALGVLVGALRRCREAGGELRLAATHPRVLRVFQITGLADVFPLHATVADACGAAA